MRKLSSQCYTPRRISFVHQAFVRIRSMALASQEKLSISPILAVREEKKGREIYKSSVRVYCSFKYNKLFPILGGRKSLTPRCTMTLAISCPHNTVLQHFNAVSSCCVCPMRTLFVLYASLNLGIEKHWKFCNGGTSSQLHPFLRSRI